LLHISVTFIVFAATMFMVNKINIFGDRSFPAAGPRVWNNLLSQLRQDSGHQLRTIQTTT